MNGMVKANNENRLCIREGAKIRLNRAYGTGVKYFVCYLSKGFCLIADCKRDFREGMGDIHSIYNIEAFEACA